MATNISGEEKTREREKKNNSGLLLLFLLLYGDSCSHWIMVNDVVIEEIFKTNSSLS